MKHERKIGCGINEGPFHHAEQKMHEGMMSAKGSTIDETFTRDMIAHHEGAIALSEILLEQG